MLRRRVIALLLVSAATVAVAGPAWAQKDLTKARERDREGAKAYGEGRYADAIRAFDESYRLGGPPFELWNIAKCHLRLDQPEQAGELLERYLATPNLPKDDRDEATQQLEALKKRPSVLTVTSSPSGANVTVDGKEVPGVTPLTVNVTHGAHTVLVSAPTGVPFTRKVDARYGRALLVEAHLKEGSTADRLPPPPNPYDHSDGGPLTIRAAVNVVAPRFGSVGGGLGVGFLALLTYRVAELGLGALSVGGMITASGDHWSNDGNGSNANTGGCVIMPKESATAISAFALLTAMFPLTTSLKLGGLAGAGFTGLAHDELGSDVFLPNCRPSPGLRPAFTIGAELDYSLGSTFRVAFYPLTLHLQPAFDGTRSFPTDATGVWMRFAVGLGAGVDF